MLNRTCLAMTLATVFFAAACTQEAQAPEGEEDSAEARDDSAKPEKAPTPGELLKSVGTVAPQRQPTWEPHIEREGGP